MASARGYLEEKITGLKGVEKRSAQGRDGFYIADQEFCYFDSNGELRLFLTDACAAKLDSALRSEPRATIDADDQNWVNLRCTTDVDVEFVFLYVRYSWKFLSA